MVWSNIRGMEADVFRNYWIVMTACMVTGLFGVCHSTPNNPYTVVDDNAPGWMWSGSQEYSDPLLYGGNAHLCGPGGYGAYTFDGVGIGVCVYQARYAEVDGRQHKIGRLKVSIDGIVNSVISESAAAAQYNVELVKLGGLKPGIHVLQVEAEGGWVVVDYVKIVPPPTLSTRSTDVDDAVSAAPVENPYTSASAHRHHERMFPTTFAPTSAGIALPVPAAVVAAFAVVAAYTGVRS